MLILSAPVLRYLLGMTLLGTGGSVLAVAILHASFNASGGLASVHGWWPSYVAMLVLLALMVAVRRVAPARLRPQARLEERGYASAGSVSTLTR